MTPELFKKNLQPTSAESLTSHHTTSPNSPFYEFTTSICSEKVIKELIQLRRKKKLKKFTYLGFWMTKEVIMPWNWRLETKRRKIEPNLESKSVAFKKKKNLLSIVDFLLLLLKTTCRWGIQLKISGRGQSRG